MPQFPKVYLYFIQCTHDDAPIKIGMAGNVQTRLRALQTGNPWLLTLLGSKLAQFPDETRLHKLLKPFRMQSEWYSSDQFVMEMITGILKPSFDWDNLDKLFNDVLWQSHKGSWD